MGVSAARPIPPGSSTSGFASCRDLNCRDESLSCTQLQAGFSHNTSTKKAEEERKGCGPPAASTQPLSKGKVGFKPAGEVVICATSSYLAKKNVADPEFSIFGKLLDKKRAKDISDVVDRIPCEDLVPADEGDAGTHEIMFPPSATRKVEHGAKAKTAKRRSFVAELVRGREKILGLIITPDFSPEFLYIEDIWDNSIVSEWNAEHGEAMQIKVGDVITAVNGVSSRADKMLETIRTLPATAIITLQVEDVANCSQESTLEPTWLE